MGGMKAVEFEGETVVPSPFFAGFFAVLEAHLAAAGDVGLADVDDEGAGLELAGLGVDLLEHEGRRNSAETVVQRRIGGCPE